MTSDNLKIQIVQGEDIRKWYWKKYYHPLSVNSSLGKSCMAGKECQDFFNIYVENPEVCQLIIMLDEKDQLICRALLWTDEKGRKIVDRIYYMNLHLERSLINWVKKNIPDATIYGEDTRIFSERSIQLKKWKFDKYPYLDTFSTLNWRTGELSDDWKDNTDPMLTLSSVNGSFRLNRSSSWVWSNKMNDFLHKHLAYWNAVENDFLPITGIRKVGKIIKKWMDMDFIK